jgi:peptidoglycan/LPS O-acetylase OafA/YrhL
MATRPGTAGRLAWLDALRGFAALCVVFDHGSWLLLTSVRGFLYQWFNLGQYGVFVFFLVSGYIVPASLERKGSIKTFWTSRTFRLYPMYAVAVVLAGVAFLTRHGTIGGAEHHPVTSVFSWLLMLPNLLTGPDVPNVTWTLSYEMVFYLLLAALFSWNIHRYSRGYALTFAIAAVVIGGMFPMTALSRWAGHYGYGWLTLDAFADALIIAGIALAITDKRRPARIGASIAALTGLVLVSINQDYPYPWSGCLILALMFTGTVIYRAEQGQTGKATAAAVVAAVLVLTTAAGLWHGWHDRHASAMWQYEQATSVLFAAATFGIGMALRNRKIPRAAAWLGVISYSVYLLHPLVFNAFRSIHALHRKFSMPAQLALFVALVAVIIAVSAVTYYLVEKPMQRLGRWLTGRGAANRTLAGRGVVGSEAAGRGMVGIEVAGIEVAGSASYATGVGSGAGERTGADERADADGASVATARSTSSSSAVAGGSGGSP